MKSTIVSNLYGVEGAIEKSFTPGIQRIEVRDVERAYVNVYTEKNISLENYSTRVEMELSIVYGVTSPALVCAAYLRSANLITETEFSQVVGKALSGRILDQIGVLGIPE